MAKNKGGRPQLEIDEKLVGKLATVGCSNESIAIQVGCSVDTITRRFAELLAKSRENMKTQLRIWQIESARKGNTSMQIWLGKQLLGQSDSPVNLENNELNLTFDKHEN